MSFIRLKCLDFGLFLICLFLLTSCASHRISGWFQTENKIKISKKEMKVIRSKALKSWNLRHKKSELEKAIVLYKKLSLATEDNYNYLTRLSRAHYFLADAHLVEIDMKKKFWEIGTSYGEKAMATNKNFARAMKLDGAKIEDNLTLLGEKEIGAMYWSASNLGKWAKNSGIVTTLKYKTLIKKLISTVEKIDRSFFYYAPDRYWGAFYAIAPGFAGGDMDKSKERFEKNIKNAPDYLGTRVLYADYYMVKKEDKKNFKRLLNEVIRTKVRDPLIHPENMVEKIKARELLRNIEDKF